MEPSIFLCIVALDQVPHGNELLHVNQFGDNVADVDTLAPLSTIPPNRSGGKTNSLVYIASGLPSIPAKLVKRIQEGQFVEMAELSSMQLGSSDTLDEEQSKGSKLKLHEVTNIVEWVQCFGTYIAIICRTEPHRIADLIGYQNLIIQSHQKYQQGHWLSYDREFRQKASASRILEWSNIDATIWNLTFSGYAATSSSRPDASRGNHTYKQFPASSKKPPICLEWNEHPGPGCPHPSCRYEHICYRCVNNPGIPNRHHKAIYCPNQARRTQQKEP